MPPPPPCPWLRPPAPPGRLRVAFGPRGRGTQLFRHQRRSLSRTRGLSQDEKGHTRARRPPGPPDSPQDRRKLGRGAGHTTSPACSPRANLPPPPRVSAPAKARPPQKRLSKQGLSTGGRGGGGSAEAAALRRPSALPLPAGGAERPQGPTAKDAAPPRVSRWVFAARNQGPSCTQAPTPAGVGPGTATTHRRREPRPLRAARPSRTGAS